MNALLLAAGPSVGALRRRLTPMEKEPVPLGGLESEDAALEAPRLMCQNARVFDCAAMVSLLT